jgi:hemerythrin-like domain-containing protein
MHAHTLPGAHSPAAGFDQPFELLAACHDRVRQRLDLLGRLVEHLRQQGSDAAARSAADDVLRYFNIAAPLHHEDEERHLVPRLLASGEPSFVAAAQQLLADHATIRQAWAELQPLLQNLAPAEHATLAAAAQAFIAVHEPHLLLEDSLVYPAVQRQLLPAEQAAMGREMAARRGAPLPPLPH